jgi:hypothetical protein
LLTNITDSPHQVWQTAIEDVNLILITDNIMDNIIKFDTIAQYNDYNNHETLHPLVSVIDLSKSNPRQNARMNLEPGLLYRVSKRH